MNIKYKISWFKRIFHRHDWRQAPEPIILSTEGMYVQTKAILHICTKCGKPVYDIYYKRREL